VLNHLLLATALTPVSTGPYFMWNLNGMNLKGAGLIDGVAIVRPLDSLGVWERQVQGGGGPTTARYLITEAEVIASFAFAPGQRIRLVNPHLSNRPTESQSYDTSKRYLVLATRQKEGKLHFLHEHLGMRDDHLGQEIGQDSVSTMVEASHPSEVAVMAGFTTRATTLAHGEPRERILYALLDALRGASRRETVELAPFLWVTRPPQFQNSGIPLSYAEDATALRIKEIAATLPPIERSHVLSILVEWRVRGSEQPFVDAVADAASDEDPHAVVFSGVNLHFVPPHTPEAKDYRFPRVPPERWLELVVGARNEAVRGFFLDRFTPKLPRDEQRVLFNAIEKMSPPHQDRVLDILAYMNDEPELRLTQATLPLETAAREELKALWRKRLGL
jgi:hypothetical protein